MGSAVSASVRSPPTLASSSTAKCNAPIVGSVVVARQAKEDELIMAGVLGGACNAILHGFNGSYYRTWNEARPLLADQRKKSKAVSCRPKKKKKKKKKFFFCTQKKKKKKKKKK